MGSIYPGMIDTSYRSYTHFDNSPQPAPKNRATRRTEKAKARRRG